MKKLEIIFWGMFLVGLLFKIMHWPFAGILTVVSLGLVSSLYLYFGFGLFNNIKFKNIFNKEHYSSIPKPNLTFGVLFGIILSIIVIGFLFKFMLWPGANLMLQSGISLLIVILISYIVLLKQGKVSIPKSAFIRIIVVGLIGLSIYIIQSDSIIDFYYPDDKPYAEALKNLVEDPNNIDYQKAFDKVREERMNQNIEDYRNDKSSK